MSRARNYWEGSPSRLSCPTCKAPKDEPCFIGYCGMARAWRYCKPRIAALHKLLGMEEP